jgi:uncharacterized protein (TIGR02646 family)
MRFLDTRKLNIPKDWKKRAEDATAELQKQAPNKRAKFIRANQTIWQDKQLKKELENLSNQKCWYCETNSVGFDLDVDHFRPKNRIKNYDTKKIEGYSYWQFAFNVTNYRLACHFCNRLHKDEAQISRGKACYFPLCDGSIRCTGTEDLHTERPILLDPTKPNDPSLLLFDLLGKAIETHKKGSEEYERASKTIDILNLNNPKTVRMRLAIKDDCDRAIQEGNLAMDKMHDDKETGLKLLDIAFASVDKLTSEKAPFSSVALAYLKSSTKVWIETYLACRTLLYVG